MDIYSFAFSWDFSTIFVHLFVVKENLKIMASFNQIGPWITVGILFSIVIFFCAFYVVKLLKTRKMTISSSEDAKSSFETDNSQMTILKEQMKFKEEIVHNIIVDVSRALKKDLKEHFKQMASKTKAG
jgi:hypothetical protein